MDSTSVEHRRSIGRPSPLLQPSGSYIRVHHMTRCDVLAPAQFVSPSARARPDGATTGLIAAIGHAAPNLTSIVAILLGTRRRRRRGFPPRYRCLVCPGHGRRCVRVAVDRRRPRNRLRLHDHRRRRSRPVRTGVWDGDGDRDWLVDHDLVVVAGHGRTTPAGEGQRHTGQKHDSDLEAAHFVLPSRSPGRSCHAWLPVLVAHSRHASDILPTSCHTTQRAGPDFPAPPSCSSCPWRLGCVRHALACPQPVGLRLRAGRQRFPDRSPGLPDRARGLLDKRQPHGLAVITRL
jgi:hypothetical protein